MNDDIDGDATCTETGCTTHPHHLHATPPQPGDPPARRIVTCQYDPEPHPLDDECVNVTDLSPVDRDPS